MSIKEKQLDYDMIVIGSGPAGVHAAFQAAKLGKRVCIVEKSHKKIGGSWIHTGTLPSKTLRESLSSIQSIRNHAGAEWVNRIIDNLSTDKLYNRANKVSMQEETLMRKHLESNGVEIIEGYGSIENRFEVRVSPRSQKPFAISAAKILIATGSRPRRPTNIPFDGWRVVDSDEILLLEQVPRSMIIYGAGVIGAEYACIFATLGVEVTVVDSRSRIMQYLDYEVGLELQHSIEALGVQFVFNRALKEVQVDGPEVIVRSDDYEQRADILFFAAGRLSCTERIGLERMGIEKDERGAIVVNEYFQTTISNIYAAGDAIGPPALASTSSQQGRHVACHAFDFDIGLFPSAFPIGVYTIPECSMAGKTEEEAKEEGLDYVVGRAHYWEIARGYIRGDSHGLLKLIIAKKDCSILGIHIVGADACNLVHLGLAFMQTKAPAQHLIGMVFNYPTLAEGYRIAAFNALNKVFLDGRILSPEAHAKKIAEMADESAGQPAAAEPALVEKKKKAS